MALNPRYLLGTPLGACLLFLASAAHGDPEAMEQDSIPEPEERRLRSGFAAQDRPMGMAEIGVGVLSLPGAEVCIERSAGCEQGDTSFEIEAWPLYRPSVRWALGAGLMLGLIPTQDAPKKDPEGVERDHSRSYFTAEAIGRRYLYVGSHTEFWLGLTGGLVVVSDRFSVQDPALADRALVGPRGVTIRTEGGAIGVAVGGALALSENWSVATTLRYGNWFLPETPAKDPFGTEASLTGRSSYFTFALSLSYRSIL